MGSLPGNDLTAALTLEVQLLVSPRVMRLAGVVACTSRLPTRFRFLNAWIHLQAWLVEFVRVQTQPGWAHKLGFTILRALLVFCVWYVTMFPRTYNWQPSFDLFMGWVLFVSVAKQMYRGARLHMPAQNISRKDRSSNNGPKVLPLFLVWLEACA